MTMNSADDYELRTECKGSSYLKALWGGLEQVDPGQDSMLEEAHGAM